MSRNVSIGKMRIFGANVGCLLVASVITGCAGGPWEVRLPARSQAGRIVVCKPDGRVASICGFNPSGDLIAWTFDKRLILIDSNTGRCKFDVQINDAARPSAYHPSGAVVVIGSRMAELWDFSGDKPLRTLDWRIGRYPGHCTFSPDGKILAMGDYSIGLWEVRSGRKLSELCIPPDGRTGYDRPVGWIGFSQDGKVVAATARGKRTEILLWSAAHSNMLRTVKPDLPDDYEIQPLALSADGATIAVRETHRVPIPYVYDGPVRMASSTLVYDTITGQRLLHLTSPVTVCNSGRMIVEWSDMRVYDLASAKLLRTIAASGQPVIADNTLVARSPHDGSYTNTVFGFWNLDSGKMLTAVCVENWYSYAKALSPDARFLILDSSWRLCVVNRDRAKKLLELDPKTHLARTWPFQELTFSTDSRKLAFVHDAVVGVVDLHSISLDDQSSGREIKHE